MEHSDLPSCKRNTFNCYAVFFFYDSAHSADDANLFDPAGLFLDKQLIVPVCRMGSREQTSCIISFIGLDIRSEWSLRDFWVDFGGDPLSNWHRHTRVCSESGFENNTSSRSNYVYPIFLAQSLLSAGHLNPNIEVMFVTEKRKQNAREMSVSCRFWGFASISFCFLSLFGDWADAAKKRVIIPSSTPTSNPLIMTRLLMIHERVESSQS